jgi:aminoglycoside phosphotransferase (APT) family kinase protein
MQLIAASAAEFAHPQAQLLHNDFTLGHIYTADGKVTGIIDFGNAQGGDPVEELARWDYRAKAPLAWLTEGYQGSDSLDFDRKLHYFRLHRGLRSLYSHVQTGQRYALPHDRTNLLEDFKYFGIQS